MRTEQFLRGYDSCRGQIQELLKKRPELQSDQDIMKLAQTPYYKEDGIDWCIDCEGCKHWVFNMDYYLDCALDVNISKIEGKCDKREVTHD